MEIFRIMLLLISALSSLYCLPSRTLNDRSTELAWQAWLLVDDQNQNRQQNGDLSDTMALRRRITPKSVFIAPTFSPESLPACADGYTPDSMGRCIKIIKIDEAAHLDFLLQKLNEQFGGFGEDEDDVEDGNAEDETTKGPFQLNIPLGESETDIDDIAIIVAPTNDKVIEGDGSKTVDKVKRTDVHLTDNVISLALSAMESTTTDVAQDETTQTVAVETTPTQPPSTTFETTTFETSTYAVETTTLQPQQETNPTTQTEEITTTLEGGLHALFFLQPKNKTREGDNANANPPPPHAADASSFPKKEYHIRDYIKFPLQQHANDGFYNHRNRDKHISLWSKRHDDSTFRFPQEAPNSRSQQPQPVDRKDGQQTIYRQVEPDELSYLFGNTRRRRNR